MASGRISVADADAVLGDGFLDLGFVKIDTDRADRTGIPELVYGEGKRPDQIVEILRRMVDVASNRAAVATRLGDDALDLLERQLPDVTLDRLARVAVAGTLPEPVGTVVIVSAGTSDEPVAAEAAIVARACGTSVSRVRDAGVAGIHRILSATDVLAGADAVVVVAGMDGALPSVVGGLVDAPVIAVPTSVGYGASFSGIAALLTMLNACAPGVTVCNIDNGVGAAVAAARIARRVVR